MSRKRTIVRIFSRLGLLNSALRAYRLSGKSNRRNSFAGNSFVNLTSPSHKRRILFDISSLAEKDHGGGIQRVQKSLMSMWESNPPSSYEIIPIYFSEVDREFKSYKGSLKTEMSGDSLQTRAKVEISKGDVYLNSDLNYRFVIQHPEFYTFLKESGVEVFFLLYDLLPLSMPDSFPEGISELHLNWLQVASEFASFICISRTVNDELVDWGTSRGIKIYSDFITLGADISIPREPNFRTSRIEISPTPIHFLVVSTIEPRKSHDLVLRAFEHLWSEGLDCKLTFVGKEGWKVEKLTHRIKTHPHLNSKLVWQSQLSDSELSDLYQSSTAIINASLGEGYGLPIVEASSYGLPLILRDIPIFREIAGNEAWYFSTNDADKLAQSLRDWISKFRSGEISPAKSIKVVSWQDTAAEIIELINRTLLKRLS